MFKKHKNQDLDMSFLWKKNPKTPSDYVRYSLEQFGKMTTASTSDTRRKHQEELFKYLVGTRELLLGDSEPKPTNQMKYEVHVAMNKHEFFL
ncbi:hypothetical protein Kpol_1001p28, partial [Vanderwaltozyma polyspora DSM 70294]